MKHITTKKTTTRGAMLPLDLHKPVQGVRFGSIVTHLVGYYTGTDAGSGGASTSVNAGKEVPDRELAVLTPQERCLADASKMAMAGDAECRWTEWPSWTAKARVDAVEALVDRVTRLYVLSHLLYTHGPRIGPYKDIIFGRLEGTRFCRSTP